MAQAYWHTPSHNRGWLLETLVFLDLRRRGLELSYFRSQEGFEVDFLARGFDTEPQAIQVSAQVKDPKTREREVRALEAVMGERGLAESTLVTLDEESRIETPSGLIHQVPAWRWLLRDEAGVGDSGDTNLTHALTHWRQCHE